MTVEAVHWIILIGNNSSFFLEIGINAIDSTLTQQPIAEKERANAKGRAEKEICEGRGLYLGHRGTAHCALSDTLLPGDCAHKCTIHSLPTPRNLEKESCEILNEGKCSRREARKRGRVERRQQLIYWLLV